jgi:TM2 domain-containing membrane protein YozV
MTEETAAPAPVAPEPTVAPATSNTRKLNWILTLVLSFFFGSLGVDRFMMGQIGWGILKLITLGGWGIWWLIDLILIVTKHQFANVEWAE